MPLCDLLSQRQKLGDLCMVSDVSWPGPDFLRKRRKELGRKSKEEEGEV